MGDSKLRNSNQSGNKFEKDVILLEEALQGDISDWFLALSCIGLLKKPEVNPRDFEPSITKNS